MERIGSEFPKQGNTRDFSLIIPAVIDTIGSLSGSILFATPDQPKRSPSSLDV